MSEVLRAGYTFPMRCLLIGNYGAGNLGDELLREYFLTTFPEVDWTVLSADPRGLELPRLPMGVRSFLTTPWWKTLLAMKSCDAVVFGGGSLLTDTESVTACRLWWLHAAVARLFRRPVLFAFQGVGPFRTSAGEKWAKRALKGVTFLSVRDFASATRAAALGLTIKIVQSFDPVFPLFLAKKKVIDPKNVLIIIPRHNSSASFLVLLERLLAEQKFSQVLIVTLQPDHRAEQQTCRELSQRCGGAEIAPIRTAGEMVNALAGASLVLSQRYHGTLAALALRKRIVTVPQQEEDKHAALPGALDDALEQMLMREVGVGEKALRQALGRVGGIGA